MREPKKHQNERSAPAGHTRYLSSPPAATLYRKTQGFVPRISPQTKPHTTLMQLIQCVLQHHVANPHLFTHMATEHDNNHAATTLRSAKIPKQPRTTHTHTQTHPKQLQPTVTMREQKSTKMNGPHPPHTHEVPFIAGCSHFTRKNARFRASALSPNQTPCNTPAANTMRFAASRPCIEYGLSLLIVMWCKLTHHHSLSIVSHFSLLRDVKSHTTLYWV